VTTGRSSAGAIVIIEEATRLRELLDRRFDFHAPFCRLLGGEGAVPAAGRREGTAGAPPSLRSSTIPPKTSVFEGLRVVI